MKMLRRPKRRPVFDDPDLVLNDLMTDWPETVAVFVRRRMLCVGCSIGPFHTVADACREYGLDEEKFIAELRQAIKSAKAPR